MNNDTKPATPPAMNAASPTEADDLLNQRWSKEADMIESWSGSATSGEEFHKHLDKCSAEVATWPAWKQRGGFGQGRATSGEAAFKKAVDAVYPIPDSPHTSYAW